MGFPFYFCNMLLKLHPENPEKRKIQQIITCLQQGGIIIYPTDTVYGIGCSIMQSKAVEKICQIKGIKPEKANLSFICNDLSHISDYTNPISNWAFKLMKRSLPGPYTFILSANNNVPKILKSKKKTVGIRVPNNIIAQTIARELGHPLLSTSLHNDDEILDYITNPEEMHDQYEKRVDMIIDGGMGSVHPSTIVDLTGSSPEIIREGAGDLDF